MEKTAILADLPHGSGAALGAFIRALYLTASCKYSIIGISVNGQGAFEKIGNTTTLVSDVMLLFTGVRYRISNNIEALGRHKGVSSLGDVYEISVSLNNAEEISTESIPDIYTTQASKKIKFTEPVNLVLTLYICKVTGLISEARSSAALAEVLAASDSARVIPTTAFGERNSTCWSTIEEHKFTENLTIHFKNDSEEELKEDLTFLQDLYATYVLEGNTLLTSLSS